MYIRENVLLLFIYDNVLYIYTALALDGNNEKAFDDLYDYIHSEIQYMDSIELMV